ncbi:MAG: hypothetical protein DWQ01_17595 [Planctomycetota bacterium]|nr:MAG: hypothetical protein DWQ01_17595 [Planctomycetota bacterium]
MQIFRLESGKDFEWLNCVNSRDYEILKCLDGTSQAKDWHPIRVRSVRPDENSLGRSSDFPWLSSSAIALRWNALKSMKDVWQKRGEILLLRDEGGEELFVFNSMTVDALDEESSVLWRFPQSGRIGRIKEPVFVEDKILGLEIFRLPYLASPTYVSQEFIDRYQACGLTGLEFFQVWPPSSG